MNESDRKPTICGRGPLALKVERGTHWWCSCGLSSHQPFCDGSHKGSGFQPVKFVADEERTVRWCMCKHSSTPPFCDGSHGTLPPA